MGNGLYNILTEGSLGNRPSRK